MMYRMKRRAMCRTEKPALDSAALKTALLSLFTAALAAVAAAAMGLGTALAQEVPNLAPGAGPATGQSALAEQGVLKSQHGDWRILCEAAAGPGAERCALVQNVESADRPGFGLVVMILKTPDDKTRMRGLIARIEELLEESFQLQRTRSSWARHVEIQAEIMKLCRQYADLHGDVEGMESPFQAGLDPLRNDPPASGQNARRRRARPKAWAS